MGMKDRVLLLILMYDPFHSCEVINTAIWFVGQLSFYENQRLTSGKSYNLNYSRPYTPGAWIHPGDRQIINHQRFITA